jgi:hypothetical protein
MVPLPEEEEEDDDEEPWAASVPGSGYEAAVEEEEEDDDEGDDDDADGEDEPKVAPIPLGHIVRYERDRTSTTCWRNARWTATCSSRRRRSTWRTTAPMTRRWRR